jgi:hypothetical protein
LLSLISLLSVTLGLALLLSSVSPRADCDEAIHGKTLTHTLPAGCTHALALRRIIE